jgi:hypothetical protein
MMLHHIFRQSFFCKKLNYLIYVIIIVKYKYFHVQQVAKRNIINLFFNKFIDLHQII